MISRTHRRCAQWLLAIAAAGSPIPTLAAPASVGNRDWSTVAAWPDLMGGIWGVGDAITAGGPAPGKPTEPIQLTERGKQLQAEVRAKEAATDGSHSCEPDGLPTDVGGEFFYSKGVILMLSDLDFAVTRQIFMKDKHDSDPELSYYGDSIGHWEGNTLVVDTIAFLPEVKLAMALPGNSQTHLVERFKLTGPDQMEYTQIIENSEMLLKPIAIVRTLNRNRKFRAHEAYCSQNNRDAPVEGRSAVDTSPPK